MTWLKVKKKNKAKIKISAANVSHSKKMKRNYGERGSSLPVGECSLSLTLTVMCTMCEKHLYVNSILSNSLVPSVKTNHLRQNSSEKILDSMSVCRILLDECPLSCFPKQTGVWSFLSHFSSRLRRQIL